MLAPVVLAFVSLVEGESCPAPVDVQARVRAILHLDAEQQLSEGFAVERREAGLYVALRSADDQLIGERVLPTTGSCDELAQAAAVVLSAWLTDVHPDFAGALPETTSTPAPPPDAPPAPAPPPPPPAAPPARSPARAASVPSRPTTASLLTGQLLLGVGGDLTGQLAPAALVGASYGATRGFALSARALVAWPRREPLGPGRVTWWRWPLAIGPTLRLSSASLALALSGGPALAWLRLVGESFDRTATQDAAAWGGFLEAVVSGQRGTWAPYGGLTVQYYPLETRAYVQAAPPLEWPLPRLALSLTVGVRFAP